MSLQLRLEIIIIMIIMFGKICSLHYLQTIVDV